MLLDEDGCYYWYFHLNPTNGGFQLARVLNDYEVMASKAKNSTTAWKEKWDAYSLDKTAGLNANFKAVFAPDKIQLYIDNELIITYTGDLLNTVVGNLVGVRTNSKGNVATDATFTPSAEYKNVYKISYVTGIQDVTAETRLYAEGTKIYLPEISAAGKDLLGWYESETEQNAVTADSFKPTEDDILYAKWVNVVMQNGFKVYENYYLSTTKNIATLVSGYSGRYGKWSADITVTDRTCARVGLMINASVPTSADTVAWNNTAINGYYMHHNVKANANFTLASIQSGVYTTHGSVFKYTSETTGKLGEYYARCADFIAGKTDYVTVRMGFEITKTAVRLYIDGEMIAEITKSDVLGLFDSNSSCIGVGFVAGAAGTRFENFEFIASEG